LERLFTRSSQAFWGALERTDTLVIGVLILAGISSLWFGGHAGHPSWQIAFSIFLVSLLALVIKMPYRLYAEQRATIHSLNERLSPKISIISPPDGIDLYPATDGSLWKYVQFIVRSTTDAPLIDCEAWLRYVDRLNRDGSKASLVEEAIYCIWSNRDSSLHQLTIPAKISLNANIFAVNDKHESVLQVQTSPVKILLPMEIQTPGRYRISIAVTAKDATTRETSFIFHWGGSFDDICMTRRPHAEAASIFHIDLIRHRRRRGRARQEEQGDDRKDCDSDMGAGNHVLATMALYSRGIDAFERVPEGHSLDRGHLIGGVS
jgi:hypothetical protein